MLEGLVAAGFYSCFYGNGRWAVLAGAGAAGLATMGYCFPEVRFAVLLLTALWVMLMGALVQTRQREELFLSGGVWLLVRSLGGLLAGDVLRRAACIAGGTVGKAGELAEPVAGKAGILQDSLGLIGSLQAVIVAAFFVMVLLYLLERGNLHPLWMAALAIMWLLSGFLSSIPYAEPWQGRVMALSMYVALGGILIFQQFYCVRQELEQAKWNGRAAQYGMLKNRFAEVLEQLGTGKYGGMTTRGLNAAENAETTEKAQGNHKGFGRRRKRSETAEIVSGIRTGLGGKGTWREAAEQEVLQLQIFEHDFRHHLDVIAALYEDGRPEEALSYMEDIKQARVSRQGKKIGGDRELSYIMLAKREACRQAQISFSYQIVGSPKGIAQMDMAALLLNLLDNAIRACREVPQPRSIGVMLLARGELWEIEMVNSGRYEPGKTGQEQGIAETETGRGILSGAENGAKTRNGLGTAAEAERKTRTGSGTAAEAERKTRISSRTAMDTGRMLHGIGLVSIRQIVEKYQGTYRIWQEAGQVRQKLILVQQSFREALPEKEDTE